MSVLGKRFAAKATPFLALIGITGVVSFYPAHAQQQTTSTQQNAGNSALGDNNGQDLTRPEDLFQLRFLYQTAPGSGGTSGSVRTVTTDTEVLRVDKEFDLGPQWKWALRGDLPFTEKNPITADNPAGDFLHGIGDADLQATIVHQFDARWAAGAGLRIVAPTGEDNLTSGKWTAQPVVGRALLSTRVERWQLLRAGYSLCDQLRRRPIEAGHQQPAIRPDVECCSSGPLVPDVVPDARHPS